ncbi:MAG: glycosyltransferase family A protein [Elusimicrobiota bacterium]|nr:glycosyltransferase family A protein [Elusimicrobiota bacterium]
MPAVSVVVTTRDRAVLLERCLRSVRAQTFRDHEVVVVDDASRDATPALARRWASRRVRFLRRRVPGGAASGRNAALKLVTGRLVAFLDDDDEWRSDKLARQVAAFADPSAAFVHTDFDAIDEAGRVLCRRALTCPAADLAGLTPRQRRVIGFYRRCPILPLRPMPQLSSVMMRTGLLRRLGGFDPAFKAIHYDLDLWLRVRRDAGPEALRFLPQPLLRYRVHEGGVTGAVARLQGRRAPAPLSPRDFDLLADNLLLGGRHTREHAYCRPGAHLCRALPPGFKPVPAALWRALR